MGIGLTSKTFGEHLRLISIRAGFPDDVRPYSIRRGVGNQLEG